MNKVFAMSAILVSFLGSNAMADNITNERTDVDIRQTQNNCFECTFYDRGVRVKTTIREEHHSESHSYEETTQTY